MQTCSQLKIISLIILMGLFASITHAEESGLTDAEMAAEAPDGVPAYQGPIQAGEVKEVLLDGIVEFGYKDENGRHVVDLLEKDEAILGVRVTTPDGRPVVGAMPTISVEGSSRLILPQLTTAEDGVMNFGVVGGQMGLDQVTASIGDTKIEFAINVISLRAAGFPSLQVIEGGITWDELMQAQLDYKDMQLVATFPDSINDRAGEKVKISGFMMPLQPELKQTHFLLTSNPPSCFFHVPGGAAGSIEVMAVDGIEVSWDPVVLEGRFEPLETSEVGVIYRLHDARIVDP